MPRNGSGVYSLPAGSTFSPNTLIQSSVVNGINTDLATDLNTPRPIVAGGTGATTAAGAAAALAVLPTAGGTMTGALNMNYNAITNPGGLLLSGFLNGLTLANNTLDAVNDIDIAAGSAATTSATPVLMTLASLITKRLDAAWTVGTNQGGLDTGAIANTTYHIWLIQRSDTGVVDACFSASASAPTTGGAIPAAYDRYRRIGAILRESAAIVAFSQVGDVFQRVTTITDISSTSIITSTLAAFSVPAGIIVSPILVLAAVAAAGGTFTSAVGSAAVGLANLGVLSVVASTSQRSPVAGGVVFTDTSRQIWVSKQGTVPTSSSFSTCGWVDTRGRI